MKQKRTYISPEVTIEQFLVMDYMMMSPLSQTIDPNSAPKRRNPYGMPEGGSKVF